VKIKKSWKITNESYILKKYLSRQSQCTAGPIDQQRQESKDKRVQTLDPITIGALAVSKDGAQRSLPIRFPETGHSGMNIN
jgi:hypothetical protein